ncbi:MAG: S24 family peptidase [Acidimicrobiia bacterium]
MLFRKKSPSSPTPKHNRLRRWTRRSTWFALLIAMFWFVAPVSMHGHTILTVVTGHSMDPTYHMKDLLYVRDNEPIEVGKPAVYRMRIPGSKKTALVVHRIVAQNKDGTYIFKGDNRDQPDHLPVPQRDIIGVPVRNLGPLPFRLLAALPIYGSIFIGAGVAWMLWPHRPRSTVDVALTADDTPASTTAVFDQALNSEQPMASVHALHAHSRPTPGQRRLRRMLEEAAS